MLLLCMSNKIYAFDIIKVHNAVEHFVAKFAYEKNTKKSCVVKYDYSKITYMKDAGFD